LALNPASTPQLSLSQPFAPNPPFIPQFVLAAAVKGYTHANLGGFAEATCPPKALRPGESLLVQVVVNPRVKVDELTPVFVRVDRPEKPGHSVHF
jgi:hypothetical protein